MSGIRAVTLLAVVVAVVGLTVPGVGAGVAGGPADGDDGVEERPMGAHVSAFMQSSTVDVNESVESGMFDVAFENADEDRRAELVANRTAALERKVERLTEEYERLQERDDLAGPAYEARMARLASQINSLERAINETEPRATEVGVDTDKLDRLRENASGLAGPEVAEVARNVAGVEPPRGPPDEVPGSGPGDRSNDSGAGPPANAPANDTPGSGPPADAPGDGPPGETPNDSDDPDDPTDDPPGNAPGDGSGPV